MPKFFKTINIKILSSLVFLFSQQLFAENHTETVKERPEAPVWTFHIGKDTYPNQADLSDLFRKKADPQIGGTCHVHAAVNLIEAYCKQTTGKEVDISESYLTYRHLRNELAYYRSYPIHSSVKDGHICSTQNCDLEGGYVENTLVRIKDGSVCTESEFENGPAFLGKINSFIETEHLKALDRIKAIGQEAATKAWFFPSWASSSAESAAKNSLSKKAVSTLCDGMDCLSEDHMKIPSKISEKGRGRILNTKDKALSECLSKDFKIHTVTNPSTQHWAVSLLSRGIPFVCSTLVDFQDGAPPGNHATTVVGYTAQTDSKNRVKIHYKVRDGNFVSSTSQGGFDDGWKFTNCRTIYYLQN